MKILVTGSSGFIGYYLVRSLLDSGHKVVGVDNHNDYYDVALKEYRRNNLLCERFKFYLQDINNMSIPENDFDLGINLAAQAGVRVESDKEYLYKHSNENGFISFCELCQSKKITKVIYASSSSVYSESSSKKFIENETELKPISKYGWSKLANEKYASNLAKKTNLSIIGLRFFSVYGPLGRPDMAYFSFAEAIKNQGKILLNNNGLMSRDMTFIDDIIDGILKTINKIMTKKKQYKNEIFNLGNDQPISTQTLLDTIQKKMKKSVSIINRRTYNEILITHADIAKAKNLLGYSPKVKFEEGIEIFLDWYLNYDS